ncbi:MAG TPA: hypothetical protein VGF17_18655, partial [Phytomonospora sp.]
IAAMNDACMSAGGEATSIETRPTGVATSVRTEFTALLAQVQSTPEARSRLGEWVTCMADRGFDVRTEHPDYDGPELWPGFRRSAEGREIEGARADADCRRDLHEYVLADGADDLAAFETAHQDALTDVAEQWRDLRAEADEVLAANR